MRIWSVGRVSGRVLLGAVVLASMAWGTLAIYWSGPRAFDACVVLALAFLVASSGMLWIVRPRRIGWLAFAALFAIVLEWWSGIPPRNDRDWQPDVAVLPWAEVRGDVATIHNVRDNEYRSESDYRLRHETRTYVSLSDARSLPLLLGIAADRPHDHELRIRRRPLHGRVH